MPGRKENDAKVMYACLLLPNDGAVGEATYASIEEHTGLTRHKVQRSVQRLRDLNFITLKKDQHGKNKVGLKGRKCYCVDDTEHVTKQGTAWIVQQLSSLQHFGEDIVLNTFIRSLKPPKRLTCLTKTAIERRMKMLFDWGYIEDGDEAHTIRLCEKTIEQRLYIELVAWQAKGLPVSSLADYEFNTASRVTPASNERVVRKPATKKPSKRQKRG